MIIKLLPDQIPAYWEPIKYAVVKSANVQSKDQNRYLNNMLAELLADTAQCFMGFRKEEDGKETVTIVCVTHAGIDRVTQHRVVYIDCLYSYETQVALELAHGIRLIKDLGAKLNCDYVVAYSANPAIYNIAESLGFQEMLRVFRTEVPYGRRG